MDSLLNGNLNTLLSLSSLPYLLNQNIQLANLAMLNNGSTSTSTTTSDSNNNKQQLLQQLLQLNSTTSSDENNNNGQTENENEHGGRRITRHPVVAFSRIYVSYPREATEYELNAAFRPFGTIVHMHVVRDYATKTDKGIAYIRYSKASEACRAYEEMNGECLNQNYRRMPVLIYISAAKTDLSPDALKSLDLYNRMRWLYVVIDRKTSKQDLMNDFGVFGQIMDLNVIKKTKCFGYIEFVKASHSALAMEECDRNRKYEAKFAKLDFNTGLPFHYHGPEFDDIHENSGSGYYAKKHAGDDETENQNESSSRSQHHSRVNDVNDDVADEQQHDHVVRSRSKMVPIRNLKIKIQNDSNTTTSGGGGGQVTPLSATSSSTSPTTSGGTAGVVENLRIQIDNDRQQHSSRKSELCLLSATSTSTSSTSSSRRERSRRRSTSKSKSPVADDRNDRKILIDKEENKSSSSYVRQESCSSSSSAAAASRSKYSLYLYVKSRTSRRFLFSLFDIVPGLVYVKPYSTRSYDEYVVKYETESSATYAVRKLNNFGISEQERILVQHYVKSHSSRSCSDESNTLSNNEERIKKMIQLQNMAVAANPTSSSVGKPKTGLLPTPNLASSDATTATATGAARASTTADSLQTETEQAVQQNLGYLLLLTQLKNLSKSSSQTVVKSSNSQTKINESSSSSSCEVDDSTVSSSNLDNSTTTTTSNVTSNPPSSNNSTATSSTSSDVPEISPIVPNLITVRVSCRSEIDQNLFFNIMKHFNHPVNVTLGKDMKSGEVKFTNELDAQLVVNTLNKREIAGNHFSVWIDKETCATKDSDIVATATAAAATAGSEAKNKQETSGGEEEEESTVVKSVKRAQPEEDQENDQDQMEEETKKAKVDVC